MKKSFLYITLIIISLLFCTKSTKAQFKDIFKYSTFYASGNIGAPFNANKQFYVNGTAGSGQLVETTFYLLVFVRLLDLTIKLKKASSTMAQKMK